MTMRAAHLQSRLTGLHKGPLRCLEGLKVGGFGGAMSG